MTSQEYNRKDTRSLCATGVKSDDTRRWPVVSTVMMVAVLARLPALGAYWNQDDWGLLARASGLIPAPDMTIRWLSQSVYWQALWPLAGLETAPYAMTRIVIHALAAGGVVCLAARMGLAPAQRWLTGLVMAATPLAFTPLYWAAGVQDLLAVCFMVWSLERWLSPARAGRPLGAVLAIAAVASKETVVGLPLLMGWILLFEHGRSHAPDASRRGDNRSAWLLVAIVAGTAIVAVLQALRFFATGPADPYALGGFFVWLRHLLTYGFWLLLPGPYYPPDPGLGLTMVGGLLWLAWPAWSYHQWQRGRRTPAFALLGALLMLAPLLPLRFHVAPDLAYPVEPFGCLALGCLWPRRWRLRWWTIAAMALAAWSWGYFGMQGRLSLRTVEGLPADPVVRRTAVSAAARRNLEQMPSVGCTLVIVQPPWTRWAAKIADDLGEQWATGSTLYHSLSGPLGPRMIIAERHACRPAVTWTNGLRHTPEHAFVMLDMDHHLLPWGMTRQALLYQTLTDLGLGFFERARLHLLRASLLAGTALGFAYDPDLLPIPLDRALANLGDFLEHLDQTRQISHSDEETEGLQMNILRLLSACTGRDVNDLIPGRAHR